MKFAILYILLLFTFTGCISEYQAKGIDELRNLLVVEGTISEGITTIKLSKSVGLHDDILTTEVVNHASVTVESETGSTYYASTPIQGTYTIYIDKLDPEIGYRLKINLDNDQYESEFSKPIMTPEIDQVFWTKSSGNANICVTTRGTEDQPRYYNWAYEEIWEIKAKYEGNVSPFDSRYYCWIYKNSNQFVLASSDKLSENVISQKKLVETTTDDRRFEELYYIKVYQNMLSKAAYDYFSNLQKNIEDTGSIFSPIPSEMKGNISCITNPDIPVIGYVEVSNTKIMETYISVYDGLYEPKADYECISVGMDDERYTEQMVLYFMEGANALFSYQRCVDCTLSGTKNKPYFWPNDHE